MKENNLTHINKQKNQHLNYSKCLFINAFVFICFFFLLFVVFEVE